MSELRQIGIVGLGRYGMALLAALEKSDVGVSAIDRDDGVVALVSQLHPTVQLFGGDAGSLQALREAGFAECDVAVVAIGDNLEESLMATLRLRDIGVPKIYARAVSEAHRRLLGSLGVYEVIDIEHAAAESVARELVGTTLETIASLSKEVMLASVAPPASAHGKTVFELDVRRTHRVTVVGVLRVMSFSDDDGAVRTSSRFLAADDSTRLTENDRLVIVGNVGDVERLAMWRDDG